MKIDPQIPQILLNNLRNLRIKIRRRPMSTISLDGYGFIQVERIVTVGRADAAPMRRLLAALPREKVVILTGGRRRRSVVLLDTGHAVITSLSVAELQARLAAEEE
jgi:regulator of extracellular matrix RemA (YlzA/DUF370 family)